MITELLFVMNHLSSFNYLAMIQLFEYTHVVRRKIPLSALCLQLAIANIFYQGCDKYEHYESGFWIYFPVMCFLCLVWEIFDAIKTYQKIYNHKSRYSTNVFGTISGFISMWTFVSISYFMANGRSFDCVYVYDNLLANILFYVSIFLVLSFSYIEYFKWGNVGPLLGYDSVERSYYDSIVNWGTTNRSIGSGGVY